MADTKGRHVVVIGAMGVGKTTVGRLLAPALGRRFHDSDEILEARTGETAAEIAAREGVERLHEIELEVFLEMCRADPPAVIAPASSVVDDEKGRQAMAENITVWLTAPEDVIAHRRALGDHRRSIDPSARAALRASRTPRLEAVSDIEVETGSAKPEDVVRDVMLRLGSLS